MDVKQVLEEFIRDVETAYGPCADEEIIVDRLIEDTDWPDLAETYRHAKAALRWDDRFRHDGQDPVRIKRFLRLGELSHQDEKPPEDTRQLLLHLGQLLDASCASDIVGEVVFELEDGRVYIAEVVGQISPIDLDYLEQIQEGTNELPPPLRNP